MAAMVAAGIASSAAMHAIDDAVPRMKQSVIAATRP
jgi:hypothetical protein